MKRFNSPLPVVATLFVLLFTSIFLNFRFIGLAKAQRETISSLRNNVEMEEYKEALRLADTIFDNNDIWDRDGSDVMSDYLDLRCAMDTTFYSSFHNKALIDSLSYAYNE